MKLNGGHCYKFGVEKLEWSVARNKCLMIGAGFDLVKVDNEAENTFLEDQITAITWTEKYRIYETYWIGLKDVMKDRFEWTDGTDESSYDNWKRGEPSLVRNYVIIYL